MADPIPVSSAIDAFMRSGSEDAAVTNLKIDRSSTISLDAQNPTTGIKKTIYIKERREITGWIIHSPQSGDVSIDLHVCAAGDFPPDSGDKINGASPLVLSGGSIASSTDLSGWGSTVIPAGSYLAFDIVLVNSITDFRFELLNNKRVA